MLFPVSAARWCAATALVAIALLVLPAAPVDLLLPIWGVVCTISVFRAGAAGRAGGGRRTDRVWWFAGIGLALTALGDGTWFWYDHVAGSDPFPSVADVLYLGAYPFLGAALVALTRRELTGSDPGDSIDAGIVVAGASALALVVIVEPFVDGGGSLLEVAVGLAYPLADLLVLGFLLRLLFVGHSSAAWSVRLLALGTSAMLAADVGFLLTDVGHSLALGQVLTVGWPVWYGLTAAAVHADRVAVPSGGPTGPGTHVPPSRLALLAVASMMAPAVIVVQSATSGGVLQATSLGVVSMVAFTLVLVRLAGLVRAVQGQAEAMARLSEIDPLTGLANRRLWEPALAAAVGAARASGRPVAVALLDIDRFKAFNDTFGHAAGDQLLVEAAASWTTALRAGDLLARIGGEEFAVLLRDVDLLEASEITDRLRRACPAVATCSAGVAVLEGAESPAELVERADRALFAAKRAGRDQTVA